MEIAHAVASLEAGKLPGAALNPCLIDNNYRHNPLYHRDAAQRLLDVARSKIRDSYRDYKRTNCIPDLLPVHTHTPLPVGC